MELLDSQTSRTRKANTVATGSEQETTQRQREPRVEQSPTLRKAAAAIHIRNDISCLQRKMWNVLLSNAYPELPDPKVQTHKIRIKDLAPEIGFDSKNLHYLKRALEDMVTTKLVWNILGEGPSGDEWGVSTALASAVIRDGLCYYSYSSHLRQKLHDPEFYAPVQLGIVRQFGSGRALALYENCLRYQQAGATPVFKIDIFRALIGVGDNPSYDDFKTLHRAVIKPSVEEVNTVSDINLQIELQREERKVTGVKFVIGRQEQATLPIESKSEFDAVLLHALQDTFCLSDAQAKEVMVLHSEDRLKAVMSYVEERYETGKVSTGKIAPYFLKTLANWTGGEAAVATSAIDRKREDTLAKVAASRQAAIEAQAARERFASERAERVESYIASLDDTAKNDLLAKFESHLHDNNLPLLRSYRKGGLRGLARLEFLKFVGRLILPPAEEAWAAFAEGNGIAAAA